jgi:hypothetical protein
MIGRLLNYLEGRRQEKLARRRIKSWNRLNGS